MSGNRYLLADKSKLLKKKLEALTSSLSGKLGNSSLQTQEAYINETIRVVGEFYKSLQDPQLDRELIESVRQDDIPDPDRYNEIWQQVINDLTTVFTELENVEDLTLANFNFITTEGNRLTSRLKAVDSKLGDYILFSLSPSKNVFFFKDSFNDLSKVDVNSALLNTEECEVNQTEGIITLPSIAGEQSIITIKQLPIINPNSNGSVGNNQELNVPFNGDMAVLLDNNPDTWFEYERVTSKSADDNSPLVLDLTINLGDESIINHIRVNPNNFGTKTTIHIDDIETSIDGQVYVSIKDDVPIAGFSTQDEENIFSLAPSTSKFAGQGLYTFTPRKVRYIHFIFRQTEPYLITTAAGNRLRYAIGLRDIDIRGFSYGDKGELVSTPFESTREIRKVLLETNQNPTSLSDLANIKYYVSPNDGGSWHEIQPKGFFGKLGVDAVPEVLDFNTGDADSIVTPVPVNAIRFKIAFTREDDAFEEGSSYLNKKIVNRSELHQVPQGSPFNIELEKAPVDGTVIVVDPMFGSRGLPDAQYVIGHAADGINVTKYRLPFKNFPRPVRKATNGTVGGVTVWHVEPVPASVWMHCEIGGERWTHAIQPLSDYTLDFTDINSYKVFIFNPNTGELEFGDSLTTTLGPDDKQPVSVYFDAEQLFPSESEDNHLAKLEFPTSNNKDDFTIKRYGKIESHTESFQRKAMVVRLEHQNIIDYTNIGTTLSGVSPSFNASPEDFVNGSEELQADSDSWSIDTENGIVYTARPLDAGEETTASYTYQPIYTLTTDEWEWATTAILRDSVSIKETAWQTLSVLEEELPIASGLQVLDFSNLSVVKGTVNFTVEDTGSTLAITDESHPFVKEVDYVNGIEELGAEYKKTTESISNSLTPIANVATFTLKENVSVRTTEHAVVFTNTTLFANEVSPGNVVSAGQYSINRVVGTGYREVEFYTTTTQSSPGKVTYYYASPNFNNIGLYSIDYKLGRVYTQRSIDPNSTWTAITVDYQYTDYRAEYKIARLMADNSYDVDITNNVITFKDNEILKHLQIPHSSMDGRTPLYLINYDYVNETREDIADLASKFTPVLKDYSLRILTKGSVV